MIINTIRTWIPAILLLVLGSVLVGQGNATLIVTGSVHGQLGSLRLTQETPGRSVQEICNRKTVL